jgi:hypothetical protein
VGEDGDKIFSIHNSTINILAIQQLIYVTAKKIEAQEDAEGPYER